MDNNQGQIKIPLSTTIDFQEVLNMFKVNKWLLALILILSIAISFVYLHAKKPKYEANILFQIDNTQTSKGIDGLLGNNLGSIAGSSIGTQMALLKSKFVLNEVVDNLKLNIKLSQSKPSLWRRLFYKPLNLNDENIKFRFFDVPDRYLNKTFVLQILENNRFALLSPTGEEVFAGQVGDILRSKKYGIKLCIEKLGISHRVNLNLTRHSNSKVINDIIPRLKISEVLGEGANRGSTGIINMSMIGGDPNIIAEILNSSLSVARQQDIKKKAQEASQTIKFLEKQLPKAKNNLLKSEHLLNKYRTGAGKINLKYQTQYLLNQFLELDKTIEEKKVEAINLSKKYTDLHPLIVSLNTDLKTIEEQKLSLEKVLKGLPKAEQRDINLAREVNVKQTLYLLLLNKIQEFKIVKAGTVSAIRILAPAIIPESPIPVSKGIVYFINILFGMIIFVSFVFGRRLLSPKVDDPHLLERTLDLPALAILPYCFEQKNYESQGAGSRVLISHYNPKNLTVEALRSLRTSAQISMASADNNIISILGITPGVGKSFVSINFSYLLASSGKKVVIIDSDLRAGVIHKYFGLDSNQGLSDVLSNNLPVDSVIQETMHENLFCITRGKFPKHPSELLMGERLKEVIEELSKKYDIVVIDTPPILLVTDAIIISSISATNYIVIGAGEHHPSEIEISVNRLKSSNVKVKGYIFNYHKEQKKLHGNSYGYKYNSKYYYSRYGYYHDKLEKS